MIAKILINQVQITVKNASRVTIFQLLECGIIIQRMSFNSILNVNYG